jgi:hypothetical protein
MNASPCQYLESSGAVWEACRDYAPGGWGRVGGKPAMTHHRIFGTDDDLLFQASLAGIQELRFDVPDGAYTVELRFAETQGKQPGERIFDVAVDGEPVCAGLDLAATAGPFAAVTKSARAECRGSAGLRVTFRSVRGEATVSAIKVTRL